MKFKPRILPRDFLDVVIGLPVGLFGFCIVFIVPTLVMAMLFGFPACLITFLLLCIVWLLFTVQSMTLDVEGIHFQRILGSPKHLSWQTIISVEEATRREVVLHGWLWPLFPTREMTFSLSTKHHFRIRWTGGYCYFPPKDIEQFRKKVSEMMEGNPTTG